MFKKTCWEKSNKKIEFKLKNEVEQKQPSKQNPEKLEKEQLGEETNL
ncbi:MAG: hypothetical protein I3273_00750 [Candidatus Moeniiplasma glomeromycotorum]|nr:hypothetical protein [Candidatus Moeniiplasma glomeromycotorum]MCE8168639.1 hypothetical protein [Candidatus Moeniiplasma glomeromycotorum]